MKWHINEFHWGANVEKRMRIPSHLSLHCHKFLCKGIWFGKDSRFRAEDINVTCYDNVNIKSFTKLFMSMDYD